MVYFTIALCSIFALSVIILIYEMLKFSYLEAFGSRVSKKDLKGRKFKIEQFTHSKGIGYTISEYMNGNWKELAITFSEDCAKSYIKSLVKPKITYIG